MEPLEGVEDLVVPEQVTTWPSSFDDDREGTESERESTTFVRDLQHPARRKI